MQLECTPMLAVTQRKALRCGVAYQLVTDNMQKDCADFADNSMLAIIMFIAGCWLISDGRTRSSRHTSALKCLQDRQSIQGRHDCAGQCRCRMHRLDWTAAGECHDIFLLIFCQLHISPGTHVKFPGKPTVYGVPLQPAHRQMVYRYHYDLQESCMEVMVWYGIGIATCMKEHTMLFCRLAAQLVAAQPTSLSSTDSELFLLNHIDNQSKSGHIAPDAQLWKVRSLAAFKT